MKDQRKILLALLSVLVVVLLLVWLWPNKSSQANHTTGSPSSTTSPSSSNQPTPKQAAQSAARDTQPSGSAGPSASSGAVLVAPAGSFVSSHDVSGTDQEDSICMTTAGASCKIIFTNENNGSDIVSLTAKQTNGSGSAEWLWKPNDIGLSAGSWKITAVATHNGQTKSATDSRLLVIR